MGGIMGERCAHPECAEPGTDVRGGFLFCFGHWLIVVQWEQPKILHEDAA